MHGAGTVELSARSVNGHVELHVTDEGPGFPAGFAERAFDRFSRGDEARGRGGTGLGLAIVQAIAEAHGGSAGLGNREGGGADVWIAQLDHDRRGLSWKDMTDAVRKRFGETAALIAEHQDRRTAETSERLHRLLDTER